MKPGFEEKGRLLSESRASYPEGVASQSPASAKRHAGFGFLDGKKNPEGVSSNRPYAGI
jgi:hypothetical protein